MTTEEKKIALEKIAQEIKAFKGLEIARNAINGVAGEGNPDSEVLFIGEAPGRNEDESGRPFVGQAGKLLEKNLNVIGLQRSDVFITNIVKYRPPDNRDPFPEEIAACKDWLDEQIKIIDPKIIVTLGRFSMGKFIEGVTISKVHGQPRFVDFGGKRYIVYPMFHPAAALRSGSMMKPFEEDFVKLSTLLTKPVSVAEAKDNNGQLDLF